MSVVPDVVGSSIGAVVDLARARAIELVVIGPEAPLADGLADALIEAGVAVFGADRGRPPRSRWSKAFCHEVAAAAGVRMAAAAVSHDAGRSGPGGRAARSGRLRRRRQGGRPRGRQGRHRLRRPGQTPRRRIGRAVSRARRTARRRRGTAVRARGQPSSRSATARGRSPCPRRATTSGSATATPGRTRAGWAPTRRSPI